jgi:hypothetical protein
MPSPMGYCLSGPSRSDYKRNPGLLQGRCDEAAYPTNRNARRLYGCGLHVTEPLNPRIRDFTKPDHPVHFLNL